MRRSSEGGEAPPQIPIAPKGVVFSSHKKEPQFFPPKIGPPNIFLFGGVYKKGLFPQFFKKIFWDVGFFAEEEASLFLGKVSLPLSPPEGPSKKFLFPEKLFSPLFGGGGTKNCYFLSNKEITPEIVGLGEEPGPWVFLGPFPKVGFF